MKQNEPFYALVSDRHGDIHEDVSHAALGRSGQDFREPHENELTPAPYGTMYFYLPDRIPMGKVKSNLRRISHGKEEVFAVGMAPPSGYTRTLLPAYKNRSREFLPFFSYCMGAYGKGEFHIAAILTERSARWDPSQYDALDLEKRIKKKIKKFPRNRILPHLSHCALSYRCYNAQNIFMGRWEGGIPVAPSCNAACLGCISKKRNKPPMSPQNRITFIPDAGDVAEIAVEHLESGQGNIISFGQGCEGEPLLQTALIEEALVKIRQKTDKGTIHMNTNGSNPQAVERLIGAGLDSIRVSMNSALEDRYNTYYSPSGFSFSTVKETLRRAHDAFVSINLLVLPGVSDSEEELDHLASFLRDHKPSMIQLRNLNIDPDLYFQKMPVPRGKKMGIPGMIARLRGEHPEIKLGSFNPPLRD